MGSAGLQWDVGDYISAARMNQKGEFVGTGAEIAGISPAYPGQQAFCSATGSGFTVDTLYQRNAANTAWNAVGALSGAVNANLVKFSTPASSDFTIPGAGTIAVSSGASPDNMRDNNTGTSWISNSEVNPWARIDTGAARLLGAVRIYWGGTAAETPNSFKIQVSDDAVTWTDVLSRSAEPTLGAYTTYEFNVVYKRYVRVIAQETLAMRINEFHYYTRATEDAIANHGHGLLS